jgi:hypothetical protein
MIKSLTAIFTIVVLLTTTLTGQTLSQPSEKPDIKAVLANEAQAYNAKAAEFDPAKADAIYNRQQSKKGWSTKDKVILAAAIVGIAALVYVLVKYGKDCLRSSPAGCTPGVDEFCTCEEYERRNP